MTKLGATTFAFLMIVGLVPTVAAEPHVPDGLTVRSTRIAAPVEVRAGNTAARLTPIFSRQGLTAEAPTSDIQVTYSSNFPSNARAAYEAAVSVWESRIVSSQVIRVTANWKALGSNVLGSAGPTYIYLLADGHWYPAALTEAMCGCTQSSIEIGSNFNSDFGRWYFGTDGNPPSTHYDFFTVVMHELGHGLGFISSFGVQAGTGIWGYEHNGVQYPMRYDVNEWSAATSGTKLTNTSAYPNPSVALLNQLTDGSVYFEGPNVVQALGGRARLYAPSPYSGGSSNSHFDEATFPSGTQNALMTPQLANGEVIHEPGSLTLALLRDIGWQTADSSAEVGTPPTVHPPVASLLAPQTVGAKVAVEVAWQPAEDDSGVQSYDLQYRRNSGSWIAVPLESPTVTSAQLMLAPGADYRFRLSATDTEGATSDFVTTSRRRLARAQENAAAVTYVGSWTRPWLAGSLGGRVKRSLTANSTAKYTFTGNYVGLVSTLGPNRGIAEIRVDGVLVLTVDLYAPSLTPAQLVWAAPVPQGSHTVKVRVTGTRNAASRGVRVDVDAFLAWK